MARKKNADDQPSAEDQALHERVYEMMELDRSKDLKAAREEPESPVATTDKPLDIFEELKVEPPVEKPVQATAPEPEVIEIDSDATDKIVDEIIVSESDALLAAEDLAAKLKTLPPSPKPESKLKRLFKK